MYIHYCHVIIIIIFSIGSITCNAECMPIENSKIPMLNQSQSEMVFNISNAESLELNDGYELAVKSIDIDGNKAYLELYKDGQIIDSKVIIPANVADGNFSYSRPGMSQTIMVHVKNTFRGIDRNPITIDRIWQTSDKDSSHILMNSNHSQVIDPNMPLRLEEGYELAVRSPDIDGNKVYLNLYKDGQSVDSQVIIAANEVDDTFFYFKPETGQRILIHFRNVFRGVDHNLVTIDSVFQTSEFNRSTILINDSSCIILTTGMDLKLRDGYELNIKSVDIDGKKVYVELSKDGSLIESKIIITANDVDDIFTYLKPDTSQKIVVHFKNAFRGQYQNLATIDSIAQ